MSRYPCCGHPMPYVMPASCCTPQSPAPYTGEPTCGDLLPWERLISVSPGEDNETALKFFISKHKIKLTKFSAEVEGEEVTIHLRVDGTYLTNLTLDKDAGGGHFWQTKELALEIAAGKLVEIYIADGGGSGSTASTAENLAVELQGYEIS